MWWKRLLPPCDAFRILDMKAACSPTSHVLLDKVSRYAELLFSEMKIRLIRQSEMRERHWTIHAIVLYTVRLTRVVKKKTTQPVNGWFHPILVTSGFLVRLGWIIPKDPDEFVLYSLVSLMFNTVSRHKAKHGMWNLFKISILTIQRLKVTNVMILTDSILILFDFKSLC